MLRDVQIKQAKPREKPYKMYDRRGLFLLVHPNGGKYWRFRYRFAGRQKVAAFGVYPAVSLSAAREARDRAREMLAEGRDPVDAKREAKAKARGEAETFEDVAREWLGKFSVNWVKEHAEVVRARLEKDIFPWLGARPIAEIDAPTLLAVLRRIEARGALHVAHRMRQVCGQIFRYAVAVGYAQRDPSADLRGALTPVAERHFAALTRPGEVGGLMRAIRGYQGSFVVRAALRLLAYTFVRSGELRKAEWREFDLDSGVWTIPAHRMKMRREHLVPLAPQAVEVLRELQPLTGSGRYVFPSARSAARPMSENAICAALRRMGYEQGAMTAHGFRTLASTRLNELGWNADVVERQLAHVESNEVRGAYNRAEYLPQRTRMMAAWANYLDGLERGHNVVALHA